MGHTGYDIIVTNVGTAACTLPAGHPVVRYQDPASGKARVLPTTKTPKVPPALTIVKGGRAFMILITIHGYGGYDPSSPACAHPAVYHNLSVDLGSGDRLPLTGLTMDVKCGDIEERDWAPGTP